jgi:hypothetical protein
MSDDPQDDQPEPPQDLSGHNFLALWRFGYDASYPSLAVMQIAFGRTPEEADEAFKGKETPVMKLVIDSEQAAELAEDFAALTKRL